MALPGTLEELVITSTANDMSVKYNWDYSGSLIFALTVVTTIGKERQPSNTNLSYT